MHGLRGAHPVGVDYRESDEQMKPERLNYLLSCIRAAGLNPNEIADELIRLQKEITSLQTLPPDLEKRLGEIENQQSTVGPFYPVGQPYSSTAVAKLLHDNISWLTTTIRSMAAHIKQLEEIRDREGQENAITVAAMGEKNTELEDMVEDSVSATAHVMGIERLQAELATERERVKSLESVKSSLLATLRREMGEEGEREVQACLNASDKANAEEPPCKS